MAISLGTEYAERVLAKMRKDLKTRFLFNTNYERNARTGTIMIPCTPEDSLGDYSKTNLASNAVSYDSNGWIPCIIDKDKFLNKYLDGYDIAALPYDEIGDNLDRLGYAAAKAIDTHAINTLVYAINGLDKNGNAFGQTDPRYQKHGTVVSIGQADFYDKLVDVYGAQTDAGVNPDGRWLLINGAGHAEVLKSNKAIVGGNLSQELRLRGVIAVIAGFEVYLSGNLTGNQSITTGTGNDAVTTSNKIYAIAGHSDFCTRVDAWAVTPQVSDANGSGIAVGGIFVQARYVFTHEVGNPEAFWLLCA